MTDAELRAIVRDAVARHLGRPSSASDAPAGAAVLSPTRPSMAQVQQPASPWERHASHHLYLSLVNVDSSCVIEPAVACDHCGYCKSHGH